jgi:hypothetical protein
VIEVLAVERQVIDANVLERQVWRRQQLHRTGKPAVERVFAQAAHQHCYFYGAHECSFAINLTQPVTQQVTAWQKMRYPRVISCESLTWRGTTTLA